MSIDYQKLSEENFPNLPPPLRRRMPGILRDFSARILHDRVSVVRDRRGDGRPFWRLYLESGSGPDRRRTRVYVGSRGGPELMEAVRRMRREHWRPFATAREFVDASQARLEKEALQSRKAARAARSAGLAQTYRRLHGRRVRARRDVPAVDRYRAEYGSVSRKALEQATWPKITEEQYVKAGDRSYSRTAALRPVDHGAGGE